MFDPPVVLDRPRWHAESGWQVRPVGVDEISVALSMILGSRGIPADRSAVGEFLKYAAGRELSLTLIWVAVRRDILGWAGLPMHSPGRTLMLLGADATMINDPDAVTAGIEQICRHFGALGAQLAQVLIDPAEASTIRMYADRGFTAMAELIYMHRSVRKTAMPPPPPGAVRTLNYSDATHPLFAAGILATYEQSLDCPQLNGVRGIEDVIAGHKAAGVFDPADWFVLVEAGQPLAVLLMSRVSNMDGMEIVYIGIRPSARRRGLGNYLMTVAAAQATTRRCPNLALAVDSQNTPAIALYHRHGFARSTSRVAMMRELVGSITVPDSSPIKTGVATDEDR